MTPSAQFAAAGFLGPVSILEAGEATRVRAHFDSVEQREGRDKCAIGLLDRHRDLPFVMELARHPSILDAAEAAIGPDILLLATHFFCKYPAGAGEERFVAWHQDVTYWGLEPPLAVTAWYAVDDSTVENGCMRVIPGTHRGMRQHGTAGRPGNLLSINQEVAVGPDEERSAVDLVLRAGEISLHHGMLIHGSNPNRSPRRRCGLTLRYVPPHVRQVSINSQGRRWQPLLVRGQDRFANW